MNTDTAYRIFKEIGEAIGRSTLSTANRYYHITSGTVRPSIPKHDGYSAEEHAKIAQAIEDKVSIKTVAAEIGRTPMAVAQQLSKHRESLGRVRPERRSLDERSKTGSKVAKYRDAGKYFPRTGLI